MKRTSLSDFQISQKAEQFLKFSLCGSVGSEKYLVDEVDNGFDVSGTILGHVLPDGLIVLPEITDQRVGQAVGHRKT